MKEKTIDELLVELHELDQKSKTKFRKLKRDGEGNLLLDVTNFDDREWYENDEDYEIF